MLLLEIHGTWYEYPSFFSRTDEYILKPWKVKLGVEASQPPQQKFVPEPCREPMNDPCGTINTVTAVVSILIHQSTLGML